MTLIVYIFIAIPICILTIIIWIYCDYRKYKRKNYLIVLLLLANTITANAQYIDNEGCSISFKQYENQYGKLEYIRDNMIYRFIPASDAWKIIIRNISTDDASVNWRNAQFIVSGKASGIALYPFTADTLTAEIVQSNAETNRTITAANLITGQKIKKIYQKRNLKRGAVNTVTIVLPITLGNKPRFFHKFDFIITQRN